ncbi:acyl-CoA thioesterase [Photobacterium alginatilyticum]|uniref:Thioesterase family protein n=1 Tax=Photobacterium alginatilyticum TaxID=1775171 RepID=A0ABW9YJ58_9GAMM|nr:thioesterase family protein [Photobacterium alginatilyticum]NBI53813.1 thioesterase family protein [Photobacterium alginatilyticum]
MHIDTLLQTAKELTNSQATMTLPEDWAQGRTAFGGISAALLYTVMKEKVADDRPLRSLTTNFVGPLFADIPFSFDVEVLREGKNASQLTARIIQDGQIAVIQQACFGTDRFSEIEVGNSDTHQLKDPQNLTRIPMIPGQTPNFIQHLDLAVSEGAMPFSGSPLSTLNGWMRFKQAPEQITDAHLISLIDAWPPAVLQMMKQPAPASTMMWNLEFIHPHQPVQPDEWFAYKAHTRQAAGGYAHLEANIWDSAGELIAISRQSVAVFS